VITGKTICILWFGITGENADYGDCLQPADPTALPAAHQRRRGQRAGGSAVAAIGTDTGGSNPRTAAICSLRYRARTARRLARQRDLAESFRPMAGCFRDLEDAPLLAAISHTGSRPVPSFTAWPSSTTASSLTATRDCLESATQHPANSRPRLPRRQQ